MDQAIAGLSSRRHGFDPRPFCVGCVVDKVARGQVFFLSTSGFFLLVLFYQCPVVILMFLEGQAGEVWEPPYVAEFCQIPHSIGQKSALTMFCL